jgi:CelD/BcsL family acetyltransferase involved in cellulose biosynthesis
MSIDAMVTPAEVTLRHAKALPLRVETTVVRGLAALEAALANGLLPAWEGLIACDDRATPYQTSGFCVPWYRLYDDTYEPYVIVVRQEHRVVGIAPMAIERATRRLVFASDTMADYADVVALPESRATVVRALIESYVAGSFSGPLGLGWSDPSSDTPALAAEACEQLGLRYTVRRNPCWRWFPEPGENLSKKFSRVRTHLNFFKRQGNVEFDVITGLAEWDAFADTFYRQHSLRQLQASREVSFEDPRKRRLYDALMRAGTVPLHVTAFRVNGRMVAGHVGLNWKDVLMLGAPSISLEDEQRSPALILMSWIIQNAAQLGLAGFDLTIGDSEFKRSLGNRRVELSMVEIYSRRTDYLVDVARARVRDAAKGAIDGVLGQGAWEDRVKTTAEAWRFKRARVGALGVRGALVEAMRYVVGRSPTVLAYSADAAAVGGAAPDRAGLELHENQIDDLLLCDRSTPGVTSALETCARSYARSRASGHTLHTLVRDGRLAAWCYTHPGDDGAAVVVEGLLAPGEPDDAAALVRGIARRSARGASRLLVRIAEDARAVRGALGAMGFRIIGEA